MHRGSKSLMKILFLCTHNRCRSILAEAIANHYGDGLIKAASAGSEPAGKVHPKTLEALTAHGIPVDGLYSKPMEQLRSFNPDVVITVCNNAAKEPCPFWLGTAPRVHWGLPDPSAISEDDNLARKVFDRVIETLALRMKSLSELLKQDPDKTQVDMLLKCWQPTGR